MKNLLYLAAGLLAITWAILYFGYNTDGPVHFLLVGAFFILLLRFFNNKLLVRNLQINTLAHSRRRLDKPAEPVIKLIHNDHKRQ